MHRRGVVLGIIVVAAVTAGVVVGVLAAGDPGDESAVDHRELRASLEEYYELGRRLLYDDRTLSVEDCGVLVKSAELPREMLMQVENDPDLGAAYLAKLSEQPAGLPARFEDDSEAAVTYAFLLRELLDDTAAVCDSVPARLPG